MRRFDIEKLRKEAYQEASFYGKLPSQNVILGLELRKVKIRLTNGETITGLIRKVGKFELLITDGERDRIIFKHSIQEIIPIS